MNGVNVWLESWQGHHHPGEEAHPSSDASKSKDVKSHRVSGLEAPRLDGEHGADAVQRWHLLRQWGVEVFVSVSSKPIERVSLRNEAAVPAWKSQSDAAQKELYTSLYEDEEEIAPENIFHDDQDDGVGLSASKRGKPPSEKTQEKMKSGKARMNPVQTVSWVAYILKALKPLLRGPPKPESKQAAKDPSKQRKGGSQCYLRIDLEPHAALLIVQPGSLACLSRIGKRASTTGAYGKYWRVRRQMLPRACVASHAWVCGLLTSARAVSGEATDQSRGGPGRVVAARGACCHCRTPQPPTCAEGPRHPAVPPPQAPPVYQPLF